MSRRVSSLSSHFRTLRDTNKIFNVIFALISGPRLDNPQCHATGCMARDIATSLMDNVNKLLIADLESQALIACGSLLQGACEKYKMSNISIKPEFIPLSVAANDENSSTYAFIGPEK